MATSAQDTPMRADPTTASAQSSEIAITPTASSEIRDAVKTAAPDASGDRAASVSEANNIMNPDALDTPSSSRRSSVARIRSSIAKTYHAEDKEAPFFAKLVFACDPYGVEPVQKRPVDEQPRGHVCGCCANFARTLLLLCTIGYTLSIMFEYQYDVVQGIIEADSSVSASLSSSIQPPRIGVYCCTSDRTIDLAGQDPCNSTGFIDVQFWQGRFEKQVKMPKRNLDFYACADDFVRYPDKPNFQELEGKYVKCPLDTNYTIVGDFTMPIYAYVQVSVHSCPWEAGATVRPGSGCQTGEIVEKWVKKSKCVFAEEYMKAELTRFVEGKVTYSDPIPILPEQKSFRFHYVHQAQQKVEMYHHVRYIYVDSWVLDSDELQSHMKDMSFKQMIPIYQYIPSASWIEEPFLTFYVRMDTQTLLAYLKPQSQVLEMISTWGSYWALFSAVFAGIITVVNWGHSRVVHMHHVRQASDGTNDEQRD
eukprot:GEMP01019289.1.p1 GENE.GEMP01019289.1~~GEMP01019289.1.p1  ORF type:complete len:479 (+),score=58.76 GEMP01019289.1:63-1499(+)